MYAFPSGHNPKTGTQESGMTLRDYFAAKAMQAYLTTSSGSTATNEMIAFESYKTADEMMKARDL